MASDLFSRYLWLIDLLSRYGKLTRSEINDHWLRASISDGKPIAERTFFHFRRAIEQNFDIDISCNSRHEYYIEGGDSKQEAALTNYLLDTYAIQHAFRGASEVSGRVLVEDVPSARRYLQDVVEAIRLCEKIEIAYSGFNRSRTERDILFHPYFVKLYKQRWYVVGLKERAGEIRTYALDRFSDLVRTRDVFKIPDNPDPVEFFQDIVGITTSEAPVRDVKIKADRTQAKYFRALPLHESQDELVTTDDYAVFTYRLKLNFELVHELLSYGSSVEVIAPPELRAMVKDELKKMTDAYSKPASDVHLHS